MAKYDVTYSCGHMGKISLIGSSSERERKMEWAKEKGLCKECYKASLPIKIFVHSLYTKGDKYDVVISLEGNTGRVKEQLAMLGFTHDAAVGWYKGVEVDNQDGIIDAVMDTKNQIKDLGNTTFNGDEPTSYYIDVKGFGERLDIDRDELWGAYMTRRQNLSEDFANR